MFTGIIEQLGRIEKIEGNRFTILHGYVEPFEVGESVAVEGVCLTVVNSQQPIANSQQPSLIVEIIGETRGVTTFGEAQVGDRVNLERAARIGQRNSGHHVTGHVDEVGKVLERKKEGDYWILRIGIKPEHRKWIVQKGSVALGGVSLTISAINSQQPPLSGANSQQPSWFEVSLISHTWEVTSLSELEEGDGVNVEFDIIGKYKHQDTFDVWNHLKKEINYKPQAHVKPREIWQTYLGKNIGVETNGGEEFLRPVLVLAVFGKKSFFGVPLTKTLRKGSYYYAIETKGGKGNALLHQMRLFDTKRVKYKYEVLPKEDFEALKKLLRQLLLPESPEGKMGSH